MGNRVIAAKRLKLQRHRRLAPRHLFADYIPTGKPPNQLVMKELKERTKSLAFDEEYQRYLDVRNEMDRRGEHISEGRRLVAAHISRLQNVCPALMCVDLSKTLTKWVRMFYNEERNRFVLLEVNTKEQFIRTSLTYVDRTRCVDAFKSDGVRWVYFSSVRPPSDGTTD